MTTIDSPSFTHTTATEAARHALARLEAAWNAGDGEAFGRAYAQDATFVNIHGAFIEGREAIAAGHDGIFRTIYAGSVNQMVLVRADQIAPGVVRSIAESTLTCPSGPLAGVHRATSTSVLVHDAEAGGEDPWVIVASANVLVRG